MSEDKALQAKEELTARLPAGVPINFDEVFPQLTGFGVKKANQRRMDYLNQAAPVLGACLRPEETVRFVTLGIVNHNAEMLFMGVWAQLINRTVIIVTTERILMIHSDTKGHPKSFANELPLESVKKVRSGFLGSLTITSGKGGRNFSAIRGADRKNFAKLFTDNKSAKGSFRHLCSSCFASQVQHVSPCPACRTEFKSPRTAAMRSLFLPGLGDWYLGHKSLAALEMVGALVTWGIALSLVAAYLESGDIGLLVFAVIILVFANAFDAALTQFQAKKGLMSLDGALPSKQAVVTSAAAQEPPPPII